MKKLIFILLIIYVLGFVAGQSFQEYYKLDLNSNKGEFELINLDIELSDTSIQNYFGFYLAEVIDYKNETLNWTYFNIPNKIFYDTIDENGTINGGGLLELDEINFTIYAPYYENANQIIIYDENLTEKLRIDVSMFSKKELIEKEKVGEEKKEIITKEKISGEEKTLIEKFAKNWWILVAILLILIIILIRRFRK